jgi:outer membrane autotransporter protein
VESARAARASAARRAGIETPVTSRRRRRSTTLAFAGSNAFTIAGVPIAKNAALVEAGLDLALSKSATLGVSYTGQLAADAQDHAFKANLAIRF